MAFAAQDDIRIRLQKDALSSAEQANATQLCAEATALICDTVGRSEAEITANGDSQTLAVLKGLVTSLTCRTMASPSQLRSASQTLGEATRTEVYRQDPGMVLTEVEERIARNAVYGTLSGTSQPRGLPDRLLDIADSKQVDEEPIVY